MAAGASSMKSPTSPVKGERSVLIAEDASGAGYGTLDSGCATPTRRRASRHTRPHILSIFEAARNLSTIAIPSALTIIFDNLGQAMTLSLIGQYLTFHELGAASVALSVMWGGFAFPLMGVTFALDTLLSQIAGFDPDSDEMGEVMQRGWIVNVLLWIPAALLCANLEFALAPLFDPKMTALVVQYLKHSPLPILTYTMARSTAKFFNNQDLAMYPAIAAAIGLVSSYFWHRWLLPIQGIAGAANAVGLAMLVEFIVLLCFLHLSAASRKTFGSLSFSRALKWEGIVEYVTLGLPSAVFVAGEGAVFDIAAVVAGFLGPEEAAAYGVIFSLSLVSVSFPGGVSVAVCTRAGNAIGDEVPEEGRRYSYVAIALSFVCACISSFIVVYFHVEILALFGESERVVAQAMTLMPIVPVFFILDAVQFTFQGIFSAMGKQDTGAYILVASLWCIGFPAMLYGEKRIGVAGVMGGLVLGMAIEIPCMAYLIFWKTAWASIISVRSPSVSVVPSVVDLSVLDGADVDDDVMSSAKEIRAKSKHEQQVV